MNYIENSAINKEATEDLIKLLQLIAKNFTFKRYKEIFLKLDEEISIRVNELTNN